MSHVLKFIYLSILVLTIISCSDDDDNVIKPPVTLDLIESAKIDPNLSIFVAALEKAELTTTLTGTGPFTVLAPSNEAFEALYIELGVIGLDEIAVPTLRNILLNHVIPDEKLSTSNLTSGQGSGYKTTLATGDAATDINLNIFFDTTNGVLFNGLSSVISGKEDIEATNGFLHQVASVIQLPSVLEFITADSNFDSLEEALLQPEQAPVLEALNNETNTPLTIFTPTNLAFTALFEELSKEEEIVTLETIDAATLTNALNLHVIANMNVRAEASTDGTIPTLGGSITSTASPATLTDSRNRTAEITISNLQASDGVVHVLNMVLLPMP